MAQNKKQLVSAHDLDRIIVRLPDGMREKIAALAKANSRSMTAEVVAALEQHLKGPDRLAATEAYIEKNREESAKLWNTMNELQSTVSGLEELAETAAQLLRKTPK